MRLLSLAKLPAAVLCAVNKGQQLAVFSKKMSSANYEFEMLKVSRPREFVVQVELNRPSKMNAMNESFWREMPVCFNQLSEDEDCRAIVLSAAGKIFTAGIDFSVLQNIALATNSEDVARRALKFQNAVKRLQETFNCIEKCPKPVIAAIHNGCVGGGVDMTSACDIRYCSQDAWFQIKEIDLAIIADVGTLQRFPKVIGNDSAARELALTARKFHADEAKSIGFVSRIFPDRASVIEGSLDLASMIASKSPVAVQGTKVSMVYNRDHSVQEGLDHIAQWNSVMVQCEDVGVALAAAMSKEKPKFSKL